jgi:hypothetical protein
MLRPTRSRLVTEIRYRPCTPLVQPDQNPIIFCIISRHFRACILESSHPRVNAWAGARVAAAAPHSAAMLPATAVALIGTIKGIARCCGIRRRLGWSQTDFARRRKRPARLCRTSNPICGDRFQPWARVLQCSEFGTLIAWKELADCGRVALWWPTGFCPTYRIVNL